MSKSIIKSITSTVKDLNKSGLVDDITMRNIENLCLLDVQEYTPDEIVSIKKNSGSAKRHTPVSIILAPSTVQKWERGNKKPTGTSKKLLDIIDRKGIEALI